MVHADPLLSFSFPAFHNLGLHHGEPHQTRSSLVQCSQQPQETDIAIISIAQARQLWPRDVRQPVLAHTAGDLRGTRNCILLLHLPSPLPWAQHLNFKRNQELKASDLSEPMGSLPWVEKATKHSRDTAQVSREAGTDTTGRGL